MPLKYQQCGRDAGVESAYLSLTDESPAETQIVKCQYYLMALMLRATNRMAFYLR